MVSISCVSSQPDQYQLMRLSNRIPTDVSNPGSYEDVVELLVPELQKRGLMWQDYAVPGGTFRENISSKPGQSYLTDDHPGSKCRGTYESTTSEGEIVTPHTIVSTPSEPSAVDIKLTSKRKFVSVEA